jgi:hypothetical protein
LASLWCRPSDQGILLFSCDNFNLDTTLSPLLIFHPYYIPLQIPIIHPNPTRPSSINFHFHFHFPKEARPFLILYRKVLKNSRIFPVFSRIFLEFFTNRLTNL